MLPEDPVVVVPDFVVVVVGVVDVVKFVVVVVVVVVVVEVDLHFGRSSFRRAYRDALG